MPFGKLPVLVIDGREHIGQTNAIARYLAREYGLAGKTNIENARIDMLVDAMQDAKDIAHNMNVAKFKVDPEKSKEAWKIYREETALPLFRRFTGFLKENTPSPWFVGDSMTWADIVVAEVVERAESLHEAGFMKDFPELKAHQERVYKTPGIAKRVATRPDSVM